jgi:uncharacterized membrane protein YidH (DUF202 family)
MSEFEDPSANTGRFQAFVERGEEEVRPSRRLPVSPGVLIAIAVALVVVVVVVIGLVVVIA